METLEQKWHRYESGQFPQEDLAELVQELGGSSLLNRDIVRNELVNLLSNPDELVRHNALGALAYHGVAVDWTSEFGMQLLSGMDVMLRLDEDRDCRRQAAAAFGSLFKCTKHRGVVNSLGRVCLNSQEEDDVRAFAYAAMLNVICVPMKVQPNPVGLKLGRVELSQVQTHMTDYPE